MIPVHQLKPYVVSLITSFLLFACSAHDEPAGYAGARLLENMMPDLEEQRAALQVCADGPTTFGIDVSRWQATIDWDQVVADGVKYAIIRVSNGTSPIDQEFVANWTNAGRVGLLRGSYQYFRPGQDPIEQADHMIDALRAQGQIGELPPVIDVEETDDQPPEVVLSRVRAWIDHVEAALNVRPMIYSGRYFWGPNVCGGDLSVCESFADYPLWHPQYGTNPLDPPQDTVGRSCPNISDTWSGWDFWQYGSRGRIQGIGGGQTDVDMNVFNGTYNDLLLFATTHGGGMWTPPAVWGGRPRGQTFPLASEPPISLCTGERLEGEMYVDNSGNQAWDAEVFLAPTPRDESSLLWSPSWRSETRVGPANTRVEPSERGTFSLVIEPQRTGLIRQTFNLVAAGVNEGADQWFSDSGGPHDEYLQLVVEARACPAELDGAVEQVNCEGIGGWAVDAAVSERYLRVRLSVVQRGSTEILISESIAELIDDDPVCVDAECQHRFFIPWPEEVDPGLIQIEDLEVIALGIDGEELALTGEEVINECLSEEGEESAAGEGEESAAGEGEESAAGEGEESAAGEGEESAAGEGEESAAGEMTVPSGRSNRDEGCTQFSGELSPLSVTLILLWVGYVRQRQRWGDGGAGVY